MNIVLLDNIILRHYREMPESPTRRPPPQPPLEELRLLRRKKFPHMLQAEFAENELGISRLHLIAVEQGRRRASAELALRWISLLGPEAKLDMFGELPALKQKVRTLKKLRKLSPETFKAA